MFVLSLCWVLEEPEHDMTDETANYWLRIPYYSERGADQEFAWDQANGAWSDEGGLHQVEILMCSGPYPTEEI